MAVLETIRRLTIEGRATGIKEASAELTTLARSHQAAADAAEATGVKTETSAKRQLSAARAYDAVRARVDESYRAELQYQAMQKTVERAFNQGSITQLEYARTLDLVGQKFGVVSLAAEKQRAELDKAAAAAARHASELQKSALLASRVNTVTGVSGLSDGVQRSADITAYGKQLDDLRAKYSPLYAAGRQYKETLAEINQAARVGALSEKERASAITDTKVAFVQQVNSLTGVDDAFKRSRRSAEELAKGTGLARHEMINLSRQAQDVVVSLQGGQGFGTVMLQQGSQILDVFATSGGTLKGFFGQVAGGLASIVTPARVAFGGIVAGAGAALFAVNQYLDAQKQVQMSLAGAGRATGATLGSINSVANAGSSAFGLSVSEAREMASALVATGRVANDNLLPIVKIGKDIARAFGVDASDAAKMLAQAMSDPVKGADMLNARLGFLDASQRRNIENLVAQNRQWEAQRALIDGVRSGLTGIDGAVSGTSRGWTAVSNTISNVWDKLGGVVARMLALEKVDLSEQIRQADERIAALQSRIQSADRARAGGSGNLIGSRDAAARETLRQEIEGRQKLTQAYEAQTAASARAFASQQSFAQESAVRGLMPEIAQREQLNNQFRVLEQLMDSLANDEGAGERLRQLGMTFEAVAKAIEKAKTQLRDFKTDNEKAAINAQIALDSVTAFSPGARADIARRQALEQNRGNPEAALRGDEAYRLSLKQTTVALSEQRRERQLYSEQSLQAANLEVQLVGKSIAAQTEARMNLQARQTLEQEAARNRTAVDEAEYQRLIKINAEIAKKAQMRALADATSNAQFQSDTLFLSSGEQNIASTMRQIHGDNAWQSQMNSTLAVQMRLNNSMREYGEIGRTAFTSVGQAMKDGKITSQEWSSILDNLSSRLMDLAMNSAWDALIGGRRGGGGGVIGSLVGMFTGSQMVGGYNVAATGGINPFPTPFANGGYTGRGHRLQPAGVVHAGEFVFDAVSTARAGVQNLYAMQSALRGYEGGGYVPAASMPAWVSPAPANSNGFRIDASDNRVIHIGAGASSETVAALRDELARDRADRKAQIISIVRQAKTERQL